MASTGISEVAISAGLTPEDTVTKTQAMELFDLQSWHLQDLQHESVENPKDSRFSDMYLYRVADVSMKALEVNGTSGRSPDLRKKREAEKRKREDVRASRGYKTNPERGMTPNSVPCYRGLPGV